MNRIHSVAAVTVLVSLLSGCFTMDETAYPKRPISAYPEAKGASVAIAGFEATFTETVPIQGYSVEYVPEHYHGRHYRPAHYRARETTTYVQQSWESQQFVDQAVGRLTAAGFEVKPEGADYTVTGTFEGPYAGERDAETWRALKLLASVFTYDRNSVSWHVRMTVTDNKTGTVVFSEEYSEQYAVSCFSPLPLLGVMCYDRTDPNYMQAWCCTALTDMATIRAADFIAGRNK